MGLPCGEKFVILTSTVFYYTPVSQTDKRTDGWTGDSNVDIASTCIAVTTSFLQKTED